MKKRLISFFGEEKGIAIYKRVGFIQFYLVFITLFLVVTSLTKIYISIENKEELNGMLLYFQEIGFFTNTDLFINWMIIINIFLISIAFIYWFFAFRKKINFEYESEKLLFITEKNISKISLFLIFCIQFILTIVYFLINRAISYKEIKTFSESDDLNIKMLLLSLFVTLAISLITTFIKNIKKGGEVSVQ